MKTSHILAAVAVGLMSGTALAQTSAMPQTTTGAMSGDAKMSADAKMPTDAKMSADAKRVRITYENLTTGQGFSPSVFMSHNGSATPLFKEGEKASFGLMRLAEEGNTGPLLVDAGKMMGKTIGMAATGLPTPPGMKSHSIEVEVTREHPMISGAFMLGMTNDGFTGVSSVNAYEMTGPKTMDLMAWEAGTEKNDEKKANLIAMMGTGRDPEDGVVARHKGIRGDADAPAEWKFDPMKPVARITIEPVTMTGALTR